MTSANNKINFYKLCTLFFDVFKNNNVWKKRH